MNKVVVFDVLENILHVFTVELDIQDSEEVENFLCQMNEEKKLSSLSNLIWHTTKKLEIKIH